MRWVYNAKPPHPDYEDKIFPGTNLTEAELYKRQIEGKIIGDPQATKTMTVEQLKAQGFVGLYIPDTNASDSASTSNET